jgi:predicted transcriptional regulator YdeE
MQRGRTEATIVTMDKAIYALGTGLDSSDARIGKDAAALGARFEAIRRKGLVAALRPRLFVAATTDYDLGSRAYHYAMGDAVSCFDGAPSALERITIPPGTYAAFVVRPRLGFLWGPAIGEAYAMIYGSWLPRSGWRHDPRADERGRRLEHFEYHDERSSRGRQSEMEIRVPVAPKAKSPV